jgi:hypothetical protein
MECVMSDCICLTGCPFFNDKMKGLDTIKEMLKKNLCQNDFNSCARYMVFRGLGREHVPADLYPNQRDRAQELLKTAGK